jgi:simple sugar transport system permease protein
VGVPLVGYAVWLAVRQRFLASVFAVVIGAAALVWYFSTSTVPGDFTTMTPYVATLLVLALASQRLRPPAADGLPYRRGQGG